MDPIQPILSVKPAEPLELEMPPLAPHRGLREWEQWKKNPTPASLSVVLKAVQPTMDSAISRFPSFNSAVLHGEAKRLAIQAVKTYDPAEGTALGTHLFNHMRPLARKTQEMSRAIAIPRDAREELAKLARIKSNFMEENNREPHDAELCNLMGIPPKKLGKLHRMMHYEFAEGGLEDDPEVPAEDHNLGLWADYVYHDLNDRDKLIMDHRVGRNGRPILSTEEVAAKLGIHPTYVNRKAQEIAQKILDGANATQRSHNGE